MVQTSVAAESGLSRLDQGDTQQTICSDIRARRVLSGRWFITGVKTGSQHSLRAQALDAANIGLQPAGLLGSDQMSRFGSVVFDYAGGRILLGAG